MKAKDLIAMLQTRDPEADVYMQQVDSRGWSPVNSIRVHRQTNWDHKTKDVKTEEFIIIEERDE